ncbi:hypothetical protein EK21DRAFT_114606 [Setomelanomma holmii]|uniref:Uncharacterized protein n=1 Tax=Setomelanomma holmii TaxID=210430 RepID=A0A9P4H3S3_9PLEO|nr:hypothetical protein EK21DRAFT_114606 [Setomelanomma holmii]
MPGAINLWDLRRGLFLLQNTLQHLKAHFDMYEDEEHGVEPEYLPEIFEDGEGLGSLRDLHKLTNLQISLAVLFGHAHFTSYEWPNLGDYLPPQLLRLTLTDDCWGYDAFGFTESVPTMAIFKQYFVGEELAEE